MLFVFTVSSFCTSAPEEREEKPRNRAFGYVAKSDAPPRPKEKTASRRRSFEKEAFCRARPKSPRGVLAKEMIPGCERKCERRLAGVRGVEKRAEAKQRGPREEAGALQAKSKDRKQPDVSRTADARRVEAEVTLGFRESSGHQADGATPPQRYLRDSRRPTCTRAAANLGVPLPQQVRCRGAHRATNTRLAERAQA